MNTEVINHSFSARVKKGITTYFKENLAILVAFIILCVGLSIATPAFFTKDNILNVLRQVATNSNLAIGLTMAIIIGVLTYQLARSWRFRDCFVPVLSRMV